MSIKDAIKEFQSSSSEIDKVHISHGLWVERFTHWEGKGKNKRLVQDNTKVSVYLDEIRKKESSELQERNRLYLEELFKDDNTVIVPAF
jgi:hypothetical protein